MSFRGGGTAGGGVPSKAGPEYVRHIPKFLQKYEHLLEKREGQKVVRHHDATNPSAAPEVAATREFLTSFEDNEEFNDNLIGATIVHDERDGAEKPGALLPQERKEAVNEIEAPGQQQQPREPNKKALKLKEAGNEDFSKGLLDSAVKHFSEAIELDPSSAILFSNRSAAHASAKNFHAALQDARKALELHPGWPKAFSRIGAALVGLKKFEEAVDIYSKALKADPNNKTLKEALRQVEGKILKRDEQEEKAGRPIFRKRKSTEDSVKVVGEGLVREQVHESRGGSGHRSLTSNGSKKSANMLSFSDFV